MTTLAKDAFFAYLNLPIEDLNNTWPADRTIMLRMTSKKVRGVMDKLPLPTVFRFNRNYSIWNNNHPEMCRSVIQHIQSYLRVSKGYITVLDLFKMVVMNEYLQDLVSLIRRSSTSLTHLNLSRNSISDEELKILAKELINCRALTCIDMHSIKRQFYW
jgi:hypothetical protein